MPSLVDSPTMSYHVHPRVSNHVEPSSRLGLGNRFIALDVTARDDAINVDFGLEKQSWRHP